MQLNTTLLQSGFTFPEDLDLPRVLDFPEKVIQFGEGNFLRAFVDWMIHLANQRGRFKGRVVVVQPIAHGLIDAINAQDGLYTLFLRGIQDGRVVQRKEIVSAVSRGINPYAQWEDYLALAQNPGIKVVISNTTEAGIAYVEEPLHPGQTPASFPGKLTCLLHRRFTRFDGAEDKGFLILPCELIDRNGDQLLATILKLCDHWQLGDDFKHWVRVHNSFCNTLVDRIVTGYPRNDAQTLQEELGYEDTLMDTGEIFHLWVIEGDPALQQKLPVAELGLNVLWVDDLKPYRERKVRVLNGAHTMTVAMAHLSGISTVREAVADPQIGRFMRHGIFDEILPHVPLEEKERRAFAESVLERFANPFIDHRWLDIALNSVSKYKTRCLPTLIDSCRANGFPPAVMGFALAALIAFYRGERIEDGRLVCGPADGAYHVHDDAPVLSFFQQLWTGKPVGTLQEATALAGRVLGNTAFWGQDLNTLAGLTEAVGGDLYAIANHGMRAALSSLEERLFV